MCEKLETENFKTDTYGAFKGFVKDLKEENREESKKKLKQFEFVSETQMFVRLNTEEMIAKKYVLKNV